MSRHKLVKTMDLDDELDDFDGGEDYDYDEAEADSGGDELTEEDQENMRIGTISVRADLPPAASHITDKQIQESLWHYYYDVDKTVTYLVNTHMEKPRAQKKEKAQASKKGKGGSFSFSAGSATEIGYWAATRVGEAASLSTCSKPFSFAEFFHDTPWLKVPTERQSLFIAPLYPRVGLLGGSSDGAQKMSKLQALAAARKKKSQEQRSSSTLDQPLANLTLDPNIGSGTSSLKESSVQSPQKASVLSFPIRKRKDSNPHEKALRSSPKKVETEDFEDTLLDATPPVQAEPSAFASTMFSRSTHPPSRQHFSMPYTANFTSMTADPFAGPSPDDIVIAAQSKASGKGGKGPPKTNGEKKANQIANGVEAMKIDDTPRATSKNLNVLAEFEKKKAKNAVNFVVIGHVDAGKSTLMGRLLYDLKVVDQRTIDRYRKEAEAMGKSSFALAWVLDQGSEERARGVTIDIATNKFETEKTAFTILDAPGHRDFIPNMIAGASQADFAILVIDASKGSFESGLKGQTKEHALLVRSMGVQRIIVAVNKLDNVSWSQERFIEIENQISAFLTTAGFQSKNLTFIPCSGLFGDNIARHTTTPEASWYKGPTLVKELDNSEPISRALAKPLRLTISDIFRGGVQNPLSISGRIESGSLQIGDALLAQPSGQKCFIKALEIDNEGVDWAVAGQNIVIHLSGIEEKYLKIGDVLCSPTNPIQNVKQFTTKVLAFEFITPMAVDIHRGRLHSAGRIKDIVAVLDKGTGAVSGKKKPRIIKPGQVARVIVELDTAVPLEAPGRVVLRSGGETIAAGLLE